MKNKIIEKMKGKRVEKEQRYATNVELRNEENKMRLVGYAAKFNNETLIGDKSWGFREVIMPTAFDNSDMRKVPLKYNHDDGYLAMASTKNGSLKLEVDEIGLRFEAELLDIQNHKDIYKMVESGLLSECSFAFTVDLENNGSEWVDLDEDIPLRKIHRISRLFDISLVDIPAYENTEVYARSFEVLEDVQKSLEDEREKQESLIRRMNMKIKLIKEREK
ncbi:MAG TPA: HK97 family phage prohead protease [Bacteroidales bacterium]|nr:HK97 family phage prohead protease [Bacteroidales bacterium]